MSTFETEFYRKALREGLLSVGGNSAVLEAVVPTSGAYALADVIGGAIELTDAMRTPGGTAILQSILVLDANNQKAPLTVFFFAALPTGGAYADNAAVANLGADAGLLRAVVQVAAADYTTVAGLAVASIAGLGALLSAEGGGSLWMVIVSGGTPTYTAGSLRVTLGLLRD